MPRTRRILAVTSLNDTRVLYVEPAKWVARLREVGADALLKCEMVAGHGGVSGRYNAWRERAFELAWLLDVLGARRRLRPAPLALAEQGIIAEREVLRPRFAESPCSRASPRRTRIRRQGGEHRQAAIVHGPGAGAASFRSRPPIPRVAQSQRANRPRASVDRSSRRFSG